MKLGCRQEIRINSRGLRKREIPYAKPEEVFRVLVIGDSAAVGFEVAPEHVFTRVAEDSLRERGIPVEFVNANLVLYLWTYNDRDDNVTVHRPFRSHGKGYFDLGADGAVVLRGVPVPRFAYDRNLRVDSAAVPQLARSLRKAGSQGDPQQDVDRSGRLFRLTAALVAEMRRVSEKAAARFRMVGGRWGWAGALREEIGLPEVGEFERFRERVPEGEQIHIRMDPHWNELRRLYGEALAESLVDQGLVPRPGETAAVARARGLCEEREAGPRSLAAPDANRRTAPCEDDRVERARG